ncbi:MAG: hypothetical protein J6A95_06420 [Clostridia bacterium]|nr:hypothetical protein [Clostridia bacterium]
MSNGEFYSSSEYNSTSEYRHFPAEIYIKPNEENKLGNEQADLGKEITTLQQKDKSKSKDNSKGLIDKIFNSIKGVATTATVAVTAVVVTTALVTNAPNVELKSIDCGDTYIEYEMEISELQEDKSYSIVVSTSNEEDIEIEIEGNGTYKNRIECLKPEWEYTLSLVCHDTALGDVAHFEVKLQTMKHIEQQPNPPPKDYTGAYSIDTIVANWQANEITVPILFENPNDQYYYLVKLYDSEGNELSKKKHADNQSVTFPIIDGINKYNLVFELYGVGENEERLIETKEIGILDYTPPSVDILDATIVGMDIIQIDFSTANLNNDSSLGFVITHSNGTVEDTVSLTSADISRGYVIINMDKGNTLSVKPSAYVKYEGSDSVRVIEYPLYEKAFDTTLMVEALTGLHNNRITFYPKGISNGAEYAEIVASTKPTEPYMEYYFNQPFSIYYDTAEEITYSVYLTNENGDTLSNEVSITIDTSAVAPAPEYNMIYSNPSDVGITYNDDGTINLYFVTNFESADENVYYQVRVGNNRYISRQKILEVANLPNETYSIEYDVCIDINGKSYSIFNYYPSGTVNEIYLENGYLAVYESATTLNLQFFPNYMYVDLNGVRIVSSNGEEIILTESDFTYDSVNLIYDTTVSFLEAPEYVTIYIEANASYGDLDSVDDYKGSLTAAYEITVNT